MINDQAIIIPFTGFKNINLESFRIYRGQNNYLYATFNGNPVFKFSEVLPTDECTIQGNVFIDENLDCIKATGENKTNTFQLEAVGEDFVTLQPYLVKEITNLLLGQALTTSISSVNHPYGKNVIFQRILVFKPNRLLTKIIFSFNSLKNVQI